MKSINIINSINKAVEKTHSFASHLGTSILFVDFRKEYDNIPVNHLLNTNKK